MNWVIKWFGAPGAVVAFITAWGAFGFPTIATSEDLAEQDRKQAEIASKRNKLQTEAAVDIYKNKVNIYLLFPEPERPVQRQFLRELLDEARRELQAAEDRKIELSK